MEPMQARDWKEVARRMGTTYTKDKNGGSLATIRKEDQELFSSPMNPGPEGDESHHLMANINEVNQSDGPEFEPYLRCPIVASRVDALFCIIGA